MGHAFGVLRFKEGSFHRVFVLTGKGRFYRVTSLARWKKKSTNLW